MKLTRSHSYKCHFGIDNCAVGGLGKLIQWLKCDYDELMHNNIRHDHILDTPIVGPKVGPAVVDSLCRQVRDSPDTIPALGDTDVETIEI